MKFVLGGDFDVMVVFVGGGGLEDMFLKPCGSGVGFGVGVMRSLPGLS